jgi:hypothetical protein
MAWSKGLKTAQNSEVGVYVTNIDNGDYIKVRSIDFAKRTRKFEASASSDSAGGEIEIRIDGVDGELLGTCKVENTGGWHEWAVQTCEVKKIKGVHDLYFVFKGGDGQLFNFDWWKFKK